MADYLETEFLEEQVNAIKEISDHITQLNVLELVLESTCTTRRASMVIHRQFDSTNGPIVIDSNIYNYWTIS